LEPSESQRFFTRRNGEDYADPEIMYENFMNEVDMVDDGELAVLFLHSY
jgi:hypothetical protein